MDDWYQEHIDELNKEIVQLRQQLIVLTNNLNELQSRRDKLSEKAVELNFGSSFESEIDYDLGALN